MQHIELERVHGCVHACGRGDFPYNWVDIISILQYLKEEVLVARMSHLKQQGIDQLFLTPATN